MDKDSNIVYEEIVALDKEYDKKRKVLQRELSLSRFKEEIPTIIETYRKYGDSRFKLREIDSNHGLVFKSTNSSGMKLKVTVKNFVKINANKTYSLFELMKLGYSPEMDNDKRYEAICVPNLWEVPSYSSLVLSGGITTTIPEVVDLFRDVI